MISEIKEIQIRQKLTFFPYLSLTLLILQRTSEHFREGIHTRSWRVRLSGYQALVPALFLPVVLRGLSGADASYGGEGRHAPWGASAQGILLCTLLF